jgi:DNA excision repair protein ERCC-4
MIVIIDTREKQYGHLLPYFRKNNIQLRRKLLLFGDYTLLGLENKIVIERKSSLDELALNLTKRRQQFKNELMRANAAGAKLVLLIENATQKDIENHNYKSLFRPNAFIGTLNSWHIKYNIDVYFCPNIKFTAKIILKLINDWRVNNDKEKN